MAIHATGALRTWVAYAFNLNLKHAGDGDGGGAAGIGRKPVFAPRPGASAGRLPASERCRWRCSRLGVTGRHRRRVSNLTTPDRGSSPCAL